MRLWSVLYGMIWIVLVEFLLSMSPFGRPWTLYLHLGLGLLIVPLAYSNFTALRDRSVPGRLKRISRATYQISIAVAVLGFPIFFNLGSGWTLLAGVTFWNLLVFFHVLLAFAVITQAAAVAIGYDMWEEREFALESPPGVIPAPPSPPPRTGRVGRGPSAPR